MAAPSGGGFTIGSDRRNRILSSRPSPGVPAPQKTALAILNDYLGISASAGPLLFYKGGPTMTEPDVLSRKIHELKEWQRVAWQRVADPMLTAYQRREIRNDIRDGEVELRQCLGMMSERLRFQGRTVDDVVDNFANLPFRLLA